MTKLLVISGGSRGIGAATIKKFAREHYDVINLSRSAPAIEGITHLDTDLSDANKLESNLAELKGKIEGKGYEEICLVHNAGLLLKDNSTSLSASELNRVLQVNVTAPAQINEAIIPFMKQGSSIIFIGSTLSEKAVAGAASYVVSKHAILGLARATCQDLAGTGIHSTTVCPGFTETEMLRDHVGNSDEILESIASNVTFKRLLKPEEIADTIWFASQTPAINGATLHANLGQIEH